MRLEAGSTGLSAGILKSGLEAVRFRRVKNREVHEGGAPSQAASNKLLQITLAFWILQSCATRLGEAAGDLISMTLHLGGAVNSILLFALFLLGIAGQHLPKKCRYNYFSVTRVA